MSNIERADIFQAIDAERERQDKLHPFPKRNKDEDHDISAVKTMLFCNEFLAVLVEEFGEVGKALQGEGDLKEELIQVASVAVRWLEQLK